MEEKYTWDLTKFCKDQQDFENKLEEVKKEAEILKTFKGQLKSPEKVLQFLEKETEISLKMQTCFVYANASLDTDAKNTSFQTLANKARLALSQIENAGSFFGPELISLGVEYIKSLIQNPQFKDWTLCLDRIKENAKHILSENEEQMLSEISKFSDSFKDIQASCFNADVNYGEVLDSKGEKHKLSAGNISSFSSNKDRVLRKNVAQRTTQVFEIFQNCMAQTFISHIQKEVSLAKIRKYSSVQDIAFSHEKLNPKVYENMVKSAENNYAILEDYYQAKKQYLGFDVMHSYDRNVGVQKGESKKYTFEEGVCLIKKALAVLGDDYVKLLDRAVSERWVDVYPKDNKRAGGYCWGVLGKRIVLMNWTDNLNSVFTLAHELGHAINYCFMSKSQKPQNAEDQPMFVAEVTSSFNEVLLTDYLLKNATDDEKIVILEESMKNIVGYAFRQIEFSKFEDFCYKTVEKGDSLTKELLVEKWKEFCHKPYEKVIDMSTSNPLFWEDLHHYYSLSYYVWQYSMAFLISNYFAGEILSGKTKALENYRKFLCGAGTKYPQEFLKELGADIEDENFFKNAFKNFEKTKNEFVRLCKKAKN